MQPPALCGVAELEDARMEDLGEDLQRVDEARARSAEIVIGIDEGDALSNFELGLTNVETHFEGDFAWAIADVEVKATVNTSSIRSIPV